MLLFYSGYMLSIGLDSSIYSKIGISILFILSLFIFSPTYQLAFNNGKGIYFLKIIFYKKTIQEFDSSKRMEIIIKQLDNKYFAGFLILENGEEILLDSRPTLDIAQERVFQISNGLKKHMNHLSVNI